MSGAPVVLNPEGQPNGNHRNGSWWRRDLSQKIIGTAVIGVLGWFAVGAREKTAFYWGLLDRVPRLEKNDERQDQRLMSLEKKLISAEQAERIEAQLQRLEKKEGRR